MNGRKSIHTRQRKAPLRGARLCYRTEHAVQRRQPHGDNMMQGGSSRFWRVVQLIHAACMRAGTCATAAGARRAWLSRQEQQEDELRTREADGRSWLFLASFLGELLRVDMNGSDVWGHLGRRNWRFFASKTQKFLRGAEPREENFAIWRRKIAKFAFPNAPKHRFHSCQLIRVLPEKKPKRAKIGHRPLSS